MDQLPAVLCVRYETDQSQVMLTVKNIKKQILKSYITFSSVTTSIFEYKCFSALVIFIKTRYRKSVIKISTRGLFYQFNIIFNQLHTFIEYATL